MMKKLLVVTWFSVFLFFTEFGINFVHASARLSFGVKPQELERPQYVTVIGDVAETSHPFGVML